MECLLVRLGPLPRRTGTGGIDTSLASFLFFGSTALRPPVVTRLVAGRLRSVSYFRVDCAAPTCGDSAGRRPAPLRLLLPGRLRAPSVGAGVELLGEQVHEQT